MKLHISSILETTDPISVFILRPIYPAYEYFARDLSSAISFLYSEDWRMIGSEVYIQNVSFSHYLSQEPENFIGCTEFKPWWK